jgi:hypothetical protein
MEVYSPKKFKTAGPGDRNEYNKELQREKVHPAAKETIIRDARRVMKEDQREATAKGEAIGEWIKRVFFERMKAFFEAEEVE